MNIKFIFIGIAKLIHIVRLCTGLGQLSLMLLK